MSEETKQNTEKKEKSKTKKKTKATKLRKSTSKKQSLQVTGGGDDPVRLYLKEIGLVELLDIDQEFWLAVLVDASKRLDRVKEENPEDAGHNESAWRTNRRVEFALYR